MNRILNTALIVAVLAAGCSVPTDAPASEIATSDLPENLRPGYTTTTTTAPVVPTEPATFYLIDQVESIVVPVVREIRPFTTNAGRLRPLFDEFRTEDERNIGLVNQLLEFDLLSATRDRDLLTINITQDDPEADVSPILLEAVAQLVWTATEPGSNVNRVRVLIDSQRQALPTSAETTDEDQTVDRSNYASFNPESQSTDEPQPEDEDQGGIEG
ncbi:MAG: GerMN domain-containing protein [Acidimicrobiaceae bacterium]|nr:GerMN domain-containing protein [Acidimicrobiaceae bacterium]MXW61582.1 GerMN domain-containing protein [Acidimicrobiaceae bacterium]MYA73929.1 GerMN domain-containing protein [Acidimicrobiaceae bacterium]MYC42226.1 GerMN domain-containing protein [Acidimicrobiaceae bacterium]MYG54953.1 GerMN domain-containing protein [Acidimicrobiaceae bacterium]